MSGDLPDVDDSTGQYVSIYLPNTQDPNNKQYHYLRIGSPDTNWENDLPADPNVPNPNNVPGGITLYTTGSYSLTAPSVNTWSSDSLNAVTDGNGTLYTATYTTGAANGMRPSTVTFQNVDQMTNTAAASSNFLNGDALTYWNGNDQSLGIGGLLWANYGATTNLFGGSIVNLTNNSVEVQGSFACKVNDSTNVIATDGISLAISPAGAGAYEACNSLILKYTAVLFVLTAITTAMNLAMTIELKTSGLDEASLKKAMQNLYDQQIAATALVTVIQVMSLILGAIVKLTGPAIDGAALHSITLNPVTGITLRSGPNTLAVSPASITMSAGPTVLNLFPAQASLNAASIGLMSGGSIVSLVPAAVLIDGTTVDIQPG